MAKVNLSDQVAEQIEGMIQSGEFQPGDRLPAERQLSRQLEVSRPSLREALKKLASQGLLHSRQGGGTFVRDRPVPAISALKGDLLDYPESGFDVLEVRHALDGQAAYLAALRATDPDRNRIRAAFERMIECHERSDFIEEARADLEFHLAITEASHNIVLLQVTRSLMSLLMKSVETNLAVLYQNADVFRPLTDQHRALMEAVIGGDPEAARNAAQSHMVFVEESVEQSYLQQVQHQRFLRQMSRIDSAEAGF